MKTLFIFRRDLRLEDNKALMEALKNSKFVICSFILDPRQLKSSYRSDNAVQFMIESLKELDLELKRKKSKLYLFYGKAEDIVKKLIEREKIDAVYFNRDYTPFSKKRDLAIERVCIQKKIKFQSFNDALLVDPKKILKSDKKPYTLYRPFFNKALSTKIEKPISNKYKNYYKGKVYFSKNIEFFKKFLKKINPNILQKGGRKNALTVLRGIKTFKTYSKIRDYPYLNGTTRLSAHNKFGTISIREFYWKVVKDLGKKHLLIEELFWRDFFTYITYHFKHVLGKSFYKKYDGIKWENSKSKFKAWCNGKTGVPIVDAGMRELKNAGWMHNRARMITASFLVKDLHIDWRWGERFFAKMLVDYDPAVNNGNWQWVASTGCDSQPYFRIFNPWMQQRKFDPKCIYIKKWIPELKRVSVKEIHNWQGSKVYVTPIIDHKIESEKAKKYFRKV
jgi:deoxyribodipyrimidine photo-lyase